VILLAAATPFLGLGSAGCQPAAFGSLAEGTFARSAILSLGSARVSRVGDGVLAIANFLPGCQMPPRSMKMSFGETPKPTRETRALPNPEGRHL
jgi:hypothetical protein